MKIFCVLVLIAIFTLTSYPQELLIGPGIDPSAMVPQDTTGVNHLPSPSEILVVYNADTHSYDTSEARQSTALALYYQQKRGIPASNLCPIDSLPQNHDYGTHGKAFVIWNSEYIVTYPYTYAPIGYASWLYYRDYIETPIKNFMAQNNLNIKYIVMMKGLPYHVGLSGGSDTLYSHRISASVCGLLSLMNQPDTTRSIIDLYYTLCGDGNYYNPYYQVDTSVTMNYRFESHHFVNADSIYLNYLVSRLDAYTYEGVDSLIDRITSTDKSGNKKWILDNQPNRHYTSMPLAKYRLQAAGFNYLYDDTYSNIDTSSNEVIGYCSHGIYAFGDSTYIYTQLQFSYPNGAIFNSYESGNANSYGGIHGGVYPHSHFGQLADFIMMGGSGGCGNVGEPYSDGIYKSGESYPAYARGYSIVDAIYQGIHFLAWQNDVIGDPLEIIAWGKQTIEGNTIMVDSNLVTDTLRINTGDTLTINQNAFINLRIHGFIVGGINMVVQNNVTFSSDSWQRALFLANDGGHPKLVWSKNPDMAAITYYKVFRKIGTGSYQMVDSTIQQYWTDNDFVYTNPNGGIGSTVKYYVISGNQSTTSGASNTVQALVNKSRRKITGQTPNVVHSYSLSQNYPNPFNPTTTIKYSIKNDGFVTLKIYDILGREVMNLVNENQAAGEHSINFNASSLPSGIYIYQLKSGAFVSSKKMVLLK